MLLMKHQTKCIICETELAVVAGKSYCAERHWNVDNPDTYRIKTKGLFGIKKPDALSMIGWTNWDKMAKAQHPFRYWLSEITDVKLPVAWRHYVSDNLDWVIHRTYHRYHRLNTGLEPGYSDTAEMLLHTPFTMLVDFIEIEKAHMYGWSDDHDSKQGPKWWQHGPLDNWRSPKMGLEHLYWEIDLVKDESWGLKEGDAEYGESTKQAAMAQEQLDLYIWWKRREIRIDPMDTSGLNEWYENNPRTSIFEINRTSPEYDILSKASYKIETAYNDEDEAMLIRLMKIRSSLWT